jgi:hypothetical protein
MGRSAEFNAGQQTCDYCGNKGHDYTVHPEAVRDVEQWQKQQRSEEFPFGDHHEDY